MRIVKKTFVPSDFLPVQFLVQIQTTPLPTEDLLVLVLHLISSPEPKQQKSILLNVIHTVSTDSNFTTAFDISSQAKINQMYIIYNGNYTVPAKVKSNLNLPNAAILSKRSLLLLAPSSVRG